MQVRSLGQEDPLEDKMASILGHLMDREATIDGRLQLMGPWQATVYGVAKSRT